MKIVEKIAKFIGALIIFYFLGIVSVMSGWIFPNIKNSCDPGHLGKVISCEAKSNPGWQNSGSYYFIAKGNPKAEFCSSFIDNYKNLRLYSDPTCDHWQQVSCEKYADQFDGSCYACDRMATNGNTHFYWLAMSSKDCTFGIFFTGSKYKPDDLKDKFKL